MLMQGTYPPPPYGTYPPPPYGAYPPPPYGTYGSYPPPAPPPPFVLPPGGLDSAPSTPGSSFFLPISTQLSLTSAGCTSAGNNRAQFIYQYADSTADGWNNTLICTLGIGCVLVGDVTNVSPGGACFTSSGRLRSLLQGGATATVSANLNMPPGVSKDQAAANNAAFKSALESALTSGAFASAFGITGATVSVGEPEDLDDDDNSLALGLGLGLGLGIPLLIAIIAAVIIIQKRRKNQTVGQSSSTPAADDADRPENVA
mmetsp:Transcript_25273/g.55119  ORF Transcript_25273/g.55119 Transcript_25273/m.55119 type:complete len:259 (+) Transcript_25273:1-777(+)